MLDRFIRDQEKAIDNIIQKAASKGYYTVFTDIDLYPQVKEILEKNGYKFHECYRKICYNSEVFKEYMGVNISWLMAGRKSKLNGGGTNGNT